MKLSPCYYERRRLALAKVGTYLFSYTCELGGSQGHTLWAQDEESARATFALTHPQVKDFSVTKLTKLDL
mgnify:CR=1 FL=1